MLLLGHSLGNVVEERNVAIVQRSFLLAKHTKQYPTDGLLIDDIIVADICGVDINMTMLINISYNIQKRSPTILSGNA